MNWSTFKGDSSARIVFFFFFFFFFFLLLKAVYSKKKEFAPLGSKFFHFRVDPFLEGGWCAGKQMSCHRSYLFWTKWRKVGSVFIYLKKKLIFQKSVWHGSSRGPEPMYIEFQASFQGQISQIFKKSSAEIIWLNRVKINAILLKSGYLRFCAETQAS